MGCGIELPDLFAKRVHLGTWFQFCNLRFQLGLLGCDVLFKGVGNRPATLHDIPRLLTGPNRMVQQVPILICRWAGVSSEVNNSNQATVKIKLGH
jgi:hypothetical protein